MTEILLPGDSLNHTNPTLRGKSHSNLNAQGERQLSSVQKNERQTGQLKAIKAIEAKVVETKAIRNWPAPGEMKELPMRHPVDSIRVELSTTTAMPTLILPQRLLPKRSADWVVMILILVFALFATVRLFYGKYLSQMFHASINYTTASRLFRERSVSLTHAAFRLDIIFVLSLSLFLYQLFGKQVNFGLSHSLLVYLIFLAATIVYVGVKQMLYAVQGSLTEYRAETQEFLYNMNLYNRILGLGLVPVTLILAFSRLNQPELIVGLGAVMAILCYILLVIRGMKILLRKDFPIFYLILYLCTLEILPLFFIYKLVLV